MERPFGRRTAFHNFEDFTVMVGNGEAYEAQHVVDLMKTLRDEWIDMTVIKPKASIDDYYFAFLTIPDFENRGQWFKEHDHILMTWETAPIVLSTEERGPGVKAPKDKPPG